MDYAQLTASIIAYAENDEATFVAEIPNFIRQAEKRIYNSVQHPSMKKRVVGTTTPNDGVYVLPADHIWTYAILITDDTGKQQYLLDKDQSFIREAYPDISKGGVPKYYAHLSEREVLLGPTPDLAYPMVVEYYGYPASIVDAGTSWLGDQYEQVLLYGCMIEAYLFMKGEAPLLVAYQKRYDDAMSQLKQVGDAKLRQDSYRTPQLRTPVF